MALEAGTKIGTYEIIAALGAGGMGEVYRARDARLGREVAIKLLPSGLAADAERLRRFEIEARAAGQLNHASLLAVYEFGLHAGTPYLVMELLEGETLRQRLSGGVAARAATAGAARGAE
ncbi:MAG: protein kinase domain-containing protein, partial [Terriglobales bacterium]